MGTHWKGGGYSATVELYILLDGDDFIDIAGVGPEDFRTREPVTFPEEIAGTIVVKVDGKEHKTNVVILAHGEPSRFHKYKTVQEIKEPS